MSCSHPSNHYLEQHLPPSIIEKIQAGAFRSLCTHLRDRSDEVQNIDLMTLSGFCRNCLAKWMVLEARAIADSIRTTSSSEMDKVEIQNIIQSLDALGYDEAAQFVYGMNYGDWKKAHSKKASDDQMTRFEDSKPLWAKMNKELLPKRSDTAGVKQEESKESTITTTRVQNENKSSLLSNVCCTDVEAAEAEVEKPMSKTRQLPPFQPPPMPSSIVLSVGILTVSDRASSGEYETGDLSGPAVCNAVQKMFESSNNTLSKVETSIVPDDMNAIQSQLIKWTDTTKLDLIITTGGTGFSMRDITPEATMAILDRPCPGLIGFCTMECSKQQPLASLSRGTAGLRGTTLIANLPGNPKGVDEIIPIFLPLALHAIQDIQYR